MIEMISSEAIFTIALEAIAGLALPIVALIVWKRYTHTKIKPFFIGVAVFILFAMLIEQGVHAVCIIIDSPLSQFITSNAFVYSIYGGLAAGICEEIGRFVAFKFCMKKENHPDSAIMYGIGHGGIECIYILGITMILYLIIAIYYNVVGYEQFVMHIGVDIQSQLRSIIVGLDEIDLITGVAAIVERIAALILQMELSVLVFAAVKQAKKSYLFLAIVLHALVDVIAGLYQTGIVTNMFILEGIIVLYVGAIFFLADKVYESLKKNSGEQ